MDDSFNELFYFPCGHFQRQQWEYYVTASWVYYHEHYEMRSIPLCGVKILHLLRTNDLTRPPAVTDRKSKNKKNGTLVV